MSQIPYNQEVKRKLVHLSSLWMAAALLLLPRTFCVILFGTMTVLTVLLEYAHYRRIPGLWQCYDFFFGRMLRDYGDGRFHLSGGAPVLAAAGVSALCFASPYSALAMATMLLGDTAAALIGRRFGRHRFANGKSLEGLLAFLAVGVLVVLGGWAAYRYPAPVFAGGLAGVAAAALLELFNRELHLDDNFAIPLAVGCGYLLGALCG
ncbi:MAG: phosphatidate cytidylyltransferase [Lentisphaeria bacterium]|nr:phosphatidate cytidylyltransferase [Lentisphaeria bacterium]